MHFSNSHVYPFPIINRDYEFINISSEIIEPEGGFGNPYLGGHSSCDDNQYNNKTHVIKPSISWKLFKYTYFSLDESERHRLTLSLYQGII